MFRRCPFRMTLLTLVLLTSSLGTFLGAAPACAQPAAFDLNQLERQKQLESTYEKAVAEGTGLFGNAEREQQIEAMRERLASREQARLDGELKKARQIFGLPSLAFIEQLRGQGGKLLKYDASRHAGMMQRLDTEIERVRKQMESFRSTYDKTPEADQPARLDLLKRLAMLGGVGSEEEKAYLLQLAEAKDKAYEQGRLAYEAKRYGDAASALDYVLGLDPAFKDAARLFLLAKLGVIENLWLATKDESGRTQALQLLKATLGSGEYARYRADAAPALARLQAGNLSQVIQSLADARMTDALQWVLNGRQLAMATGVKPSGRLPEETAILAKLRDVSELAAGAGMPGLAYAYQRVAEELIPNEAETRRLLGERKQAAEAATRPGVRPAVEAGAPERAALVSALQSRLEKRWPVDVLRVVDASHDADWILTLTIADAGVDADERKGKKLVRVAGGNDELSVELGLLRKRARLTVSVALVESGVPAATALAKSETFRSQAEDERHDGVEVGSFKLPVKLADLPTDAAMLEALAGEAAAYAIGRLQETRGDPVRRLAERAARLQKANQPGSAAQVANAFALSAVAKERSGQLARADYERAQLGALQVAGTLLRK